jgi:hypothetical protein
MVAGHRKTQPLLEDFCFTSHSPERERLEVELIIDYAYLIKLP